MQAISKISERVMAFINIFNNPGKNQKHNYKWKMT